MIAPCMGGWCRIRESCRNYRNPTLALFPDERLCERGADGLRKDRQRVDDSKPASEWRLSASELETALRVASGRYAMARAS